MPKTPEGKKRSSQNATVHGLRSLQVTILPDETREGYDDTRDGWMAAFEPEGYHETRLVEQLILNDWLLKRANRRLLATEAEDPGLDREHRIELILRYKTTNERAFYRALSAIEGLRKDILRERIINTKILQQQSEEIADLRKRVGLQTPKPEAKKKGHHVSILDQWAEIEVSAEGNTVTTLYPANEILKENGRKLAPRPELVYRRLHFVGGVPDEYAWATQDPSIRMSGGMGTQRMTVETWLHLIEREKALGTGHLLPCGGNLPRPEERGGCECPVCAGNRSIFEARAS